MNWRLRRAWLATEDAPSQAGPPSESWALRHRFMEPGTHLRSTVIPMLKKHPRMSLSRDEENFLRHWMYDEVHYAEGQGPAKQLQVEHGAAPADLAVLIAAGIPDPAEQEAVGFGPPLAEPPAWPWPGGTLSSRLAEARTAAGDS